MIDKDSMVDFFYFLDDLRESGQTNMYGAAPYLCDEFDMDKKTANEVLLKWMETYDPCETPEERLNNENT